MIVNKQKDPKIYIFPSNLAFKKKTYYYVYSNVFLINIYIQKK